MSTTLTHLTFDCTDAAALAAFWAAVLDRPVDDDASAEYACISGLPGWMFLKVPEAKAVKNRVHPDLAAPDLAVEVQRLQALGATHLADHEEDGAVWSTLADPEGNEVDVVAAP
jgi:catechol 2,3-dioxygenase-like lactoylglutathione lyase family enzyme